MKQYSSPLLFRAAKWLLGRYRRTALELLRIEAAVWYVRGVNAGRLFLIGGLALALLVELLIVGFVLLHVGLYALLPAPANAITILALGAFYLLVAGLVLRWLCAEKTWMKYSKADRCVAQAIRQKPLPKV